MRDRSTIFLDLDGVLVDNGPPLGAAFRRGVSEALHARYGGDLEAWARAHDDAYANAPPTPPELPPLEAYRWQDMMGVRGPCLRMGVEPPSEEVCATIGHVIDRRVRLELADTLPGAAEAIRELRGAHVLHMASGNAAWAVEGVLERMGVQAHLGLMCGADLVGVMKGREDFYDALFAVAGASTQDAIVVDDSARILVQAKAAGAATGLVVPPGREVPSDLGGVDLVVGALSELAGVLG